MSQFIKFCGNLISVFFNSSFLLEMSRDSIAPTCLTCCFVCFSKDLPKGDYANLSCFIIWLEGNNSSSVRYSYLSILPDDLADISVASLLVLYCSFSSLILSSIVMISFYILSKRFSLKCDGLSDARVTSITKKEYGFAVHFL